MHVHLKLLSLWLSATVVVVVAVLLVVVVWALFLCVVGRRDDGGRTVVVVAIRIVYTLINISIVNFKKIEKVKKTYRARDTMRLEPLCCRCFGG